jgi:DNA-binding transcriptional ArsR family regulator
METVLWQVLAGTRGGPNRVRILQALDERPRNCNQLAEALELNYNTVRNHLEVLEDNGIVRSTDSDYGAVYLITDRTRRHRDMVTRIVDQARS